MRIVYHAFEGRYSDSPRALHEALRVAEPGSEHVWLTAAGREDEFPSDVQQVPYGGAACVAALESADLVVANTHTDLEWTKPPGARYLQTWHGAPLKRIHWDVHWAPEGRLERLQRDVDRWDLLLAPNASSAPLLRGAFHYGGPVIESGYPRNDRLLAPERAAVRARVRAELGIADDEVAVLYTPTWRDDAVFEAGGRTFALGLDLDAFARRLGTSHRLLLRLHYMVREALPADDGAVRDVSAHPEVSDLYLAADVLVTDYSSTMFDFAVTGKPIVLLAPDLADYADRLRGFYYDYRAMAPGPVVETTDELVAVLVDLTATQRAYADRYATFRERFCHLDDGGATARVLAAL